MTCPHATSVSEYANSCGIGLHGGNPSKGVCAYCVSKGENTPEHAAAIKVNPPSFSEQVKGLGKAVASWTTSGFPIPDPETFNARLETCKGCEFWDESGFVNTGRCQKCGCSTQAKLRMATEKCPIGKW
jgi:hypothetical protein